MAAHNLVDRLAAVRETIDRSLSRAGRGHPVTIVAVTKTHPAAAVREALAAGLGDVGENRVQEAIEKQDALPGVMVRWHLIGTMQRNKARLVPGRFALIHSVDRVDLATDIARRVAPGTRQQVLLQVNCSAEPQKGGVEPAALPRLIEDVLALPSLDLCGLMTMAAFDADESELRHTFGLLRRLRDEGERRGATLPQLIEDVLALPALDLCGLMTMAAFDADESELRHTFGLLRRLRDEGERRGATLPELSMGMSGDYPIAVEEGATLVRLGTVLFGERT